MAANPKLDQVDEEGKTKLWHASRNNNLDELYKVKWSCHSQDLDGNDG